MVVFPGLSESLSAVGKRISRFDSTDTQLSVQAANSVRSAVCPSCSRGSSRRHGHYRRHSGPNHAWAVWSSCTSKCGASSASIRNVHARPLSSRLERLLLRSNAARSVSVAHRAPSPRRWADLLQLVYRQSWECQPVVTRCCVHGAAWVGK
jgi:hypothetical protein